MNWGDDLPQATILASSDWLAYVSAMTEAFPLGVNEAGHMTITSPTEEDVLWAWPDGVVVVFDRPVEVRGTEISFTDAEGNVTFYDEPLFKDRVLAAIAFGPTRTAPVLMWDLDKQVSGYGEPRRGMPCMFIGVDLYDVTHEDLIWGETIQTYKGAPEIAQLTRFTHSIVIALGHRLTALTEPATERHMRRRWERTKYGPWRVLDLSSPQHKARSTGDTTVIWSKRWFVRGHYRLQPHGPHNSLRKPKWIAQYIKGPDDAPLDTRPTIWRAEGNPQG